MNKGSERAARLPYCTHARIRIAEVAGLTLMTTLPTPARGRRECSVGGVWGLVGQGYAGSLLFGPLVDDVGDGEVFERQSL